MKRLLIALAIFSGLVVSFQAKGADMAIKDGNKVSFDYTLTVDGEVIDTSEGRQPLSYTQGQGQIIQGLESEMIGLLAGDERTVIVQPKDGYGEVNPDAIQEIPKESLPAGLNPTVGMTLAMQGPNGQQIPVKVSAVNPDSVVLDLNHPLAGKTLNFKVKVVTVE